MLCVWCLFGVELGEAAFFLAAVNGRGGSRGKKVGQEGNQGGAAGSACVSPACPAAGSRQQLCRGGPTKQLMGHLFNTVWRAQYEVRPTRRQKAVQRTNHSNKYKSKIRSAMTPSPPPRITQVAHSSAIPSPAPAPSNDLDLQTHPIKLIALFISFSTSQLVQEQTKAPRAVAANLSTPFCVRMGQRLPV